MTTQSSDKPRGTVQKFKDARGRTYYRARITFPDGERLELKPRFDRRERAEEYADEAMASVTRDDVEDIRDMLDLAIREQDKRTACNVAPATSSSRRQ